MAMDDSGVPSAKGAVAKKIVFITREPMVHQMGGSTTCALNLLELLTRCGAEVTVVAMTACSRSPRLFFRAKTALPKGVRYVVPEMWQFGTLYVKPFSLRAWARLLVRMAVRVKAMSGLSGALQRMFGDKLFSNAWDLTPVTERERAVALRYVMEMNPSTVVVNYFFWGPLFGSDEKRAEEMQGRRCVVLMHDLLSARVAKFLAAGVELDCPLIEEATELDWLNRADCVLAAQAREAEKIQPLLTRAKVVVQPMVFTARAATKVVEAKRVLFVGSNIAPNKTGLTWFLEKVWPLVRAADADATLAVVGSICGTLEAQQGEPGMVGVELMGLVPSIEEEYARAAVCVIPLLVGSGIKIKLLEALSYGKATVSTTIGVQGLEDWASGAVEVTDDAAEFAAAVVRLMHDAGERKRLAQGGLALAEMHFGANTELPPEFVEAVLG